MPSDFEDYFAGKTTEAQLVETSEDEWKSHLDKAGKSNYEEFSFLKAVMAVFTPLCLIIPPSLMILPPLAGVILGIAGYALDCQIEASIKSKAQDEMYGPDENRHRKNFLNSFRRPFG